MTHRDLILSARKKARFAFLALPEGLQDEVIDGLDGQTLTLADASALVKARGHSLSHEAIAGYYRALRTERRLLEVNQELSRVIGEFAGKPRDEALSSLVNLVIATAASGLADGSVGIREINLPKLVEAAAKAVASKTAGQDAGQPKDVGKSAWNNIPDAETIRKIREQYL